MLPEIHDMQGGIGGVAIGLLDLFQLGFDALEIGLNLGGFGLEGGLIDDAQQVGIEQPVLHALSLADALAETLTL